MYNFLVIGKAIWKLSQENVSYCFTSTKKEDWKIIYREREGENVLELALLYCQYRQSFENNLKIYHAAIW